MRSKNLRRLILVIVWCLVLLLLGSEYYQVKKIRLLEHSLDHFTQVKIAVRKNRTLGDKVFKTASSLYTQTERPTLAWLEIEEQLVAIANSCGFKNMNVSTPPEINTVGQTVNMFPIRVSFFSKFQNALEWISVIEKRFPALDILALSIRKENSVEGDYSSGYTVVLSYRFKKVESSITDKRENQENTRI